MSDILEIKILYKLSGDEDKDATVLNPTTEEFDELDDSLSDREKAAEVAKQLLPDDAQFWVFIKDEH